jgi:hypothetical protein
MPLMPFNLMKFVMFLSLIKKILIVHFVLRDCHRLFPNIVILTVQNRYTSLLLKNSLKLLLSYFYSVRKCTPFPPNVTYKSRLLSTPLNKCPLVKNN